MALAKVAYNNELQTMERLLAEDVSADVKDGDGRPALWLAAQGGHLDALSCCAGTGRTSRRRARAAAPRS